MRKMTAAGSEKSERNSAEQETLTLHDTDMSREGKSP